MRDALTSLLLVAACSHPQSKTSSGTPGSREPWEVKSRLYFGKLADVMDASAGDCAKLVEGLKTLEEDSKDLAKALVDANHELKDHAPAPGTIERIEKHGVLFDRCELEKTPGLADALITTLFVVEPLKSDRTDSAFRYLFKPH